MRARVCFDGIKHFHTVIERAHAADANTAAQVRQLERLERFLVSALLVLVLHGGSSDVRARVREGTDAVALIHVAEGREV